MIIGICAKVTPASDARIKVSEDGSSVDAQGSKAIVSPYDAIATEEAVCTKETHGGEVVSFTVGEASHMTQIRSGCLAVGVDRAVLIEDEALSHTDALGTARALAAAIQKEDVGLLFCGKVAIDDDNVQVPAMVSELLGWPIVSRISEFSLEGNTFTAVRNMDGGVRETVTGSLPAVLTTDRGLNTPRYAKLPDIMKAKRKPITTASLDSLGLSPDHVQPKITILKMSAPPDRGQGKIIEGDAETSAKELVRLLREEAKVI